MLVWPYPVRCVAVVALLGATIAGAGCAASHAARSVPPAHATASATQAPPPPPPVPADPLALLPLDTQSIALVDAHALVSAAHFAVWRGWAERHGCVGKQDLDWLASTTQRALFAARGKSPAGELLAVLSGTYVEADVARALTLLESKPTTVAGSTTALRSGRFSVSTVGALSAAQLEGRLLLVGDTAFVHAALDAIESPLPTHLADTEPFHRMHARLGCSDRAVCVLVAPGAGAALALKRALAGVGMKALGRELAQGALGVSADLRTGLELVGSVELASEAQARSVEKQINDWLWQLGVFARFAGFPDVLDRIQIRRTEISHLGLQLTLDEAMHRKVEQRVSEMLEDTIKPCSP